MKRTGRMYLLVATLCMGAGWGWAGNEYANNTFYGYQAGSSNLTGSLNAFFGAFAGTNNFSGTYNTFVGDQAGFSNLYGSYDTFLGNGAGRSAGNIAPFASFNTFVGSDAGYHLTTGDDNTFIGYEAGHTNGTGISNTFVGSQAGKEGNGSGNTLVGHEAGYNCWGNRNTMVGEFAGKYNHGWNSVFIGWNAGANEEASNRLYIANSDTSEPLIYGEFDNKELTVNGNLEIIGPDNGLVRLSNTTTDNTTKASRMVLHHYHNAELPVYLFGAASTDTDNYVALGGGAAIGNAATQIDLYTGFSNTHPIGIPRLTILYNGNVGIGTQHPNYPLEMASGARVTDGGVWTNGSSREYKKEIKELSGSVAMKTLEGLNPVTFKYKAEEDEQHVGFIAEDVPDLVATKDRKGLSPMDIVAVLTKVVQELKAENEGLKAKNVSLENRLSAIEATIKASK